MNALPASRRKSLLAVGLAVVLFGGGLAVGVAGSHLIRRDAHRRGPHGDHHGRDHKLDMFKKRLDLTDEQAAEIEAIFDATMVDMKALHERSQAQILEVLDEGQQAKFREMIEHHRGRRGHRRPRH